MRRRLDGRFDGRSGRRYRASPALPALLLLGAAACTPTVKVQAPDKPIEINMNIRIEQEVRIRIDRELDDVFRQNPELFGLPAAPKPAEGK